MSITLHNGDCLEVMKLLPDNSIDLIICDLPYGCLSTKGNTGLMESRPGRKHIPKRDNINVKGCAWDVKLDLKKFWEQVKRIRKDEHTPCIHFCTTKFGYELIKSNEDEFRHDLVWDKGCGVSFLLANKMPMRSHEMVYVFSKAGAYYNRVDISGDFKKWKLSGKGADRTAIQYNIKQEDEGIREGQEGKRCALSVIQNKKSSTKGGHPTEKPVELYKWLIQRYCPTGGTILDPTAGSFNSCVAGQELGMTCIGIEMNKEFYDKAVEKLGAE
jgi:site-specific DNA-methyltransferase (adenine-specific)